MRELVATGWLPNYLRQLVAGFLIEFLHVDWRHGQLFFHDVLVDADVAVRTRSNTLEHRGTRGGTL